MKSRENPYQPCHISQQYIAFEMRSKGAPCFCIYPLKRLGTLDLCKHGEVFPLEKCRPSLWDIHFFQPSNVLDSAWEIFVAWKAIFASCLCLCQSGKMFLSKLQLEGNASTSFWLVHCLYIRVDEDVTSSKKASAPYVANQITIGPSVFLDTGSMAHLTR